MNEHQRHVKARKSILRGETPEKRIFIPIEDLEFKEGMRKKREEDRKRAEERLDMFKEFKMPWFCPECDKVMKSSLDDKMWRLYRHCFDCQIKIENKMRIDGTYDEYAQKKVLENKKSWIKEQIQGIEEWKNQDDVVFYNQINPDVGIVDEERYKVDKEHIEQMANEALEELNEMIEEVGLELGNTITT
jgi:hypothetical protein